MSRPGSKIECAGATVSISPTHRMPEPTCDVTSYYQECLINYAQNLANDQEAFSAWLGRFLKDDQSPKMDFMYNMKVEIFGFMDLDNIHNETLRAAIFNSLDTDMLLETLQECHYNYINDDDDSE